MPAPEGTPIYAAGDGVVSGTKVRKGEVIGKVGSTGQSTGPHLHYEVRLDGKHLNPADFY